MRGEHALPCAPRDLTAAALPPAREDVEHVLRILRQCDLPFRLEDEVEAGPDIGNDRRAAGSRLEQPDAWAVADARHVAARQIQGKAAAAVEASMPTRRDVLHARH